MMVCIFYNLFLFFFYFFFFFMTASIVSLYIINKYGGMVYNNQFSGKDLLSNNDHLRLASTFHGLHTISTELAPNGPPSGGIEELQTDTFRLQCYETPTGVKFYAVADNKMTSNLDSLLKNIYELYCDYVLKNPFYETDQPIRCELFDEQLQTLVNPRERVR
mmetsp:Transcript_1032/g.1660  ORF Transcript_1032/g.1660 Transcript_1032/m.1660 type:complete len:162 (-) Transcript_1032:97-582(-)